MKKFYILTLLIVIFCALGAKAQVITDPPILQENSKDVTIYFHADQGNKGLMGLNANTKIYAHTGLITNKSKDDSDWKYTIASWDKDIAKAEMIYSGNNLWRLEIPDIRGFYGVTDMQEVIQKLAFVFRTSGGTKEGKTATGGDILVTVYDPGLQVLLTSNLNGSIIDSTTGQVTFTLASTDNANLSIFVNGEQVASQSGVNNLSYTTTFTSQGDYVITGQATLNDETVMDILNVSYLDNPQALDYPGGIPIMGPVANTDGSVTFCVAAPEMSRMVLVGSWNNYQITSGQQMYYQDYETTNPVTNESGTFRYFWITIPDLAKTNDQYIYYFKVQGTIKVGSNIMEVNVNTCDPYARLILDPWNDKYIDTNVYPNLPAYPFDFVDGVPVAVYQNNINDYNWECQDFEAPNQDNLIIYEMLLRDFTGTEGQAQGNGTVLLALEKLDYLQALGVNAIEWLPMYEFDGNLSWGYNPNFYFAPDKAYGTPDDYKLFIDECHKRGIAVILDMVFNQSAGQHPWCQMYGGAEFSPFYNAQAPHDYSVLNDWLQDYPLVQVQWADVLKYWIEEYKFDGFRFDLVKGLGLNGSYTQGTEAKNLSRVAEMAYLNGVIKQYNPMGYCINENLAGPDEENLMAEDGEINWANIHTQAGQFAKGNSSNSGLERMLATKDNRLWGSTISYLESHDEQRLAYLQNQSGVSGVKGNNQVSMQRLGSAAAQMIMTPGSHMIWQFSEMGNSQNTKKPNGDNNTDNKIVNWNLLNNQYNRGLYNNYCELINIRFANPEFFSRENQKYFISNCTQSNWSGGRTLYSKLPNGIELVTAVNPTVSNQINISYTFTNKDNTQYQIMSKSYGTNPSFNASTGIITVPPNSYVVIGTVGLPVAGVEDLVADSVDETILRVYGATGEIIVDYAPNGASIYSLDGKVVGSVKESGSVAVASGLYIVKSGKKAVKVIVK